MTTNLEDRLRSDLPRLARLIEQGANEEPTVVVPTRGRRHRKTRAIAAAVAACVAVGGVTVLASRGRHELARPSNGRVVITNRWRALPPSTVGPRGNGVVVWTGREVIVWGGYRGDPNAPLALQTGETYDPTSNTWHKIADNRWAHPGAIGVWANDRLYVLAKNGGAEYFPTTDTWRDIALLPDETGGGFLGAAWSGTTLFGIVGGRDPGTISVARYDGNRAAWIVGKAEPTSLLPGLSHASTVWTGKELAVSDGLRSVWAYDPSTDAWRALPSLGTRTAWSSIANVADTLVAVYSEDGHLRAARAAGNGWLEIADSPKVPVAQPIAVDGHGTMYVIDRSGRGATMRADPSTRRWVPLDGSPITDGVNGTAVWAGTGLFVWGGLPSGTPATFTNPTPSKADAAWYEP